MKDRVKKLQDILEYHNCKIINTEIAPNNEALMVNFEPINDEFDELPDWLEIRHYRNGKFNAFIHNIVRFDKSCNICGGYIFPGLKNQCINGHKN